MASNNSICSFFSDTSDNEPKKKVFKKKNSLINSDSVNIKNEVIEESSLCTYINKGCCIRCMLGNCELTHKNNVPFPNALTYFLKRPIYINLLKDVIQNHDFGFEETQEFNINICTFIYAKNNCNNCKEGRFKFIEVNGKQIKFCYPKINKNFTKMPIWLHIDLKFNINSNNSITILEVFPLNEESLTNNKSSYEKNSYNKNKSNNETNSLVSDMSFDNFNMFPNFNDNIIDENHNNINKIDYTTISNKHHINEDITNNDIISNNMSSEENIFKENAKTNHIEQKQGIDFSKENFAFLKQCYDKDIRKYIDEVEDNNEKTQHKYNILLREFADLNSLIKLLEKDNLHLKNDNNNLESKIQKRLKEINNNYENAKILGNAVVKQYMETKNNEYKN
jgi:hypothetical protein